MNKELATLVAALIGACGGSVIAPIVKGFLAHKQARTRHEERIVQMYLTQLQDAITSLWHRFQNIKDRSGANTMTANYWEVSMLYAWARVMAYSRVLRLDGIYAQLVSIGKAEVAESLRSLFDRLDAELKDDELQYYHRITLAEAVIVRNRGRLTTSTFVEFSRRYSQEEEFRLSLKPAKNYSDYLPGAPKVLAKAMATLAEMAREIAEVTKEPAKFVSHAEGSASGQAAAK